jgi:hypothetical protein
MSNQKPLKKVTLDLSKTDQETKEEIVRIYKDKNYETKKALGFKTDADKPKLA